jgi:hypothetical protein
MSFNFLTEFFIDIYTPSELNQCLFKRRMFSSRARSASELILRMNKHSFNSRGLYNILFNFATDNFNSRIIMNYVKYCNKNQVCDSGNTSVTTILL